MKRIIDFLQDLQYVEIGKVENKIEITIGKYSGFESDFLDKTLSLDQVEQARFDLIEFTVVEMLKELNKK